MDEELVEVHIAVVNYSKNCIDSYTVEMKPDWQDEDVELWLAENTCYDEATCYYMCANEPIGYYKHDLNEGDVIL